MFISRWKTHQIRPLYTERGGTRSVQLLEVANELWAYCMPEKTRLKADHLKGMLCTVVDQESWVLRDSSICRLKQTIFNLQREKVMGQIVVDLFADWTNTQNNMYVSWKPDPFALAADAIMIPWNRQVCYVFQICKISRSMAMIRQDKATAVVLTPIRQTQSWYASSLNFQLLTH